jgi:Na+-driven multidrug efflux pump
MAVIGSLGAAVLILFPEVVFGLFTQEPEVLDVCMEFIPVAVVIFIGSAFRAPANALSNGTGNFAVNFAIAILDAIVIRIGLALLLGLTFGMGYTGFWFGDAIAGFTPFVVGGIFYLSGKWKTNNVVSQEYKKIVDTSGVQLSFIKVAAHANNSYNSRADAAAKRACA